jgi:hypothetical protein
MNFDYTTTIRAVLTRLFLRRSCQSGTAQILEVGRDSHCHSRDTSEGHGPELDSDCYCGLPCWAGSNGVAVQGPVVAPPHFRSSGEAIHQPQCMFALSQNVELAALS